MFATVTKVIFTKEEPRVGETVVRLIAFESDPDTGALSVHDILETDADNEAGIRWLADKAVYEFTDAEIVFPQARTVDDFDTGRFRKMQSKIIRAIQQLEV
jgi:hypothetical protein